MLISPLALYGFAQDHLKTFSGGRLETDTLAAFNLMQKAAKKEGIHLDTCSTFRDFNAQQAIWDNKAQGLRPILDSNNQTVEINDKSDNEIIDLILRWSALPGTSRHHWGTDLDVFDSRAIKQCQLQLIDSEYHEHGPCYALYQWLQKYASHYGFYFPYQIGLSGVSPEPWHLSYYPLSAKLLKQFDPDQLAHLLAQSHIQLKHALLPRLGPLVNEYVLRVAPCP
ncbi:M15 family metallopeptidase [Shewanella surugensis]|uniref:M15 family metallopeptidase n=1 Tax=Shewanella surugensis TaxID=212020 RepID=A0ABT0LE99_9GAMM|nr:M15 family metallopeptidase [Shewanella surugensis]MCL1125481.1 M15 family metallopeptidase [Shewanella surugensis]